MNTILNYFIEANLGLVFFYILFRILLIEETSSSFKRSYLLGTISVSLLFPLVTIDGGIFVPTISAVLPGQYLSELTMNGTAQNLVSDLDKSNFTMWSIVIWIYFIGTILFTIRFFLRLLRLFNLVRMSNFQEIPGGYKVSETPDPLPTFSFFNYIFIGNVAEFSSEEKKQLIKHEAGHARMRHSFDITFIEILSIVFWFNPLIKNYKNQLITIHEFQADANTVQNRDVKEYCSLMAKVALMSADLKLVNHFTNSLTIKRIQMLHKMKKQITTWKLTAVISCMTLFFFVIACQDQVMTEITEVAKNSTMAVEMPKTVKNRLEELQAQNPGINYVVVELNEEGKQTIANLESKFGRLPGYFEMILVKDDQSDKEGVVRSFGIMNFDDNARQVAENSMLDGEVFTMVEEPASPVGGFEEYYNFISSNMKYPINARNAGVDGKVYIEFVIEKDGTISNIRPVKGIGSGCDEEAVRVVALSPPWKPGKQRGVAVRQKMVMPITFKL